ncbi:MAG TPA: ribonuclease Z [Bacteroidales bacterium]|nr:ribonuclease Z [Bacteroidales bacterium]
MRFELHILGSNAALPSPGRHPAAQVLLVDDQPYLIDCGEGTQMLLADSQIRYHRIGHIFISHLHGDHFFGLIGLMSTYNLVGRTRPLHVYGHAALENVISSLLEVSGTVLKYPYFFHPVGDKFKGLIHDDDHVQVTAFPLDHRIATHGFLFREKARPRNLIMERVPQGTSYAALQAVKQGEDLILPDGSMVFNTELTYPALRPRSYAYVSDTRFKPDICDVIKGVDLLYHEATFLQDMMDTAREKYHATTLCAARIAAMAGAGKLLLGHFSARYEDLDVFQAEASAVFPDTELALEGRVFKVEERREAE